MRGRNEFFLELGEALADVLKYQVRYSMHWGHKVSGKGGQVDATRVEYNAAFGVESPDPPPIPDAVTHVWEWWWKLNARRVPGFDSMSPLTYSEIYHWSVLTRTKIATQEINMLIMMDDAYLQAVNAERKEQRERDKS